MEDTDTPNVATGLLILFSGFWLNLPNSRSERDRLDLDKLIKVPLAALSRCTQSTSVRPLHHYALFHQMY